MTFAVSDSYSFKASIADSAFFSCQIPTIAFAIKITRITNGSTNAVIELKTVIDSRLTVIYPSSSSKKASAKETVAAKRRIRTRRSSNCSTEKNNLIWRISFCAQANFYSEKCYVSRNRRAKVSKCENFAKCLKISEFSRNVAKILQNISKAKCRRIRSRPLSSQNDQQAGLIRQSLKTIWYSPINSQRDFPSSAGSSFFPCFSSASSICSLFRPNSGFLIGQEIIFCLNQISKLTLVIKTGNFWGVKFRIYVTKLNNLWFLAIFAI